MKIRTLLLTLVVALSFGLAACDFGQVDQGRCVAFDAKERVMTLIQDVKHDQQNPEYSGVAVAFKLPTDPAEMGPEPTAGGRLKLDVEKSMVIIFNPNTKVIENIAVKMLDVQRNIGPNHPLVKGKAFPIIDMEKGTITEFSRRQKILCTFQITPEQMAFPPATWEAGNEMRVYFKKPGQALRVMNISKTNIYSR